MDNVVINHEVDIEDKLGAMESSPRNKSNPNRDLTKNVIDSFFEQHSKRDVKRFPMQMAKYVQIIHSNYITGMILVLKVVREDYQSYNLNDDPEITEDWIKTYNDKGLVAYVEFWKI